jgi:hypothetical protein
MNISITITGSSNADNCLVILGNSFNRFSTILDADRIRSLCTALDVPWDASNFIHSMLNTFRINTFGSGNLLDCLSG